MFTFNTQLVLPFAFTTLPAEPQVDPIVDLYPEADEDSLPESIITHIVETQR